MKKQPLSIFIIFLIIVILIVHYWAIIDEFSAVYLAIPAIENNTNHIEFKEILSPMVVLKGILDFLKANPLQIEGLAVKPHTKCWSYDFR